MLILLIWNRPYVRRSGNILNIVIQVIRVLSVLCILVFVEELGIAQTTQTITGVVLIAVQAALTGVLAILIGINAAITFFKENPHRKARKEAEEKMTREFDNLTPLDARNSLLVGKKGPTTNFYEVEKGQEMANPYAFSAHGRTGSNGTHSRMADPYVASSTHGRTGSNGTQHSGEYLVNGAAPMAGAGPGPNRPPRGTAVPGLGGYGGYRGVEF